MKPIIIRLITFLPAMLLAMVLSVLALSAHAQNTPSSPGTVNPFAEPLRQQMLDLPLPLPGVSAPAPAPKASGTETSAELESLRVEYVVGEEAGLRLGSSGGAPNAQNTGRAYLVHHGEPVLIGGRKYHVTVVRERVRLFEDEFIGGKSRRGDLAWAGSVESRVGGAQTAGGAGSAALATQMFVGTNMPSPSSKVISQSVDYGPKGVVAAGGMGGAAGAAGAAAAAAPR